jgi:hypothetical protein
MKTLVAAIALGAACLLASAPAAFASAVSGPPAPPPPPNCGYCQGPPPPPTPVPTVAPVTLPVVPAIDVKVSDTKVSRGDTVKVDVEASTDDEVEVVVQYHSWKPKTYKGKVGSSGSLVETLTIPRHAPLGKATVKVTVSDPATTPPQSKTFTLVVSK